MAQSSINVSKAPIDENLQDEKLQWLVDFLEKPYFKPCLMHLDNAENSSFPINKFCVDCKAPVCAKCITEFDHGDHAIIQVYRHVYQDAVTVKSIKTFMNINDIQTYKCNQIQVVALRPLLSISEVNRKADSYLADTKLGSPSRSSNKAGCTKIIISDQAATSSLYKKCSHSERICQICGRRLLPMHKFTYCSIQCKLADYMNKSDHSMAPFLMPEMKPVGEVPDNVKIEERESYVNVEERDESSMNIEGNGKNINQKIVEDGDNVKVEEEAEKIKRQIARRRKRKGIPHRAPFF